MLAAWSMLAPAPASAQKGRPVVAIERIDDLANSGQSAAFSAMIETAIEATNKFRVIEREHLGKLLTEQARARSGLVTSNHPKKMGGFEGADFQIYGTITTLSLTKKTNFGSSIVAGMFAPRGSAMPNCENTLVTLGVDIKITDGSTGEVRYVTRINETQQSAASCAGNGQIDSSGLLRAAAEKVATALVTTIYPVQIAAVQNDGTIVLNYGEGALQPGQILGVYAKGDVIRDPATGEVIANNEVKLGFIRVTDVTGRVSKATPLTAFAAAPPVGSIVRLASPADVDAVTNPKKRR